MCAAVSRLAFGTSRVPRSCLRALHTCLPGLPGPNKYYLRRLLSSFLSSNAMSLRSTTGSLLRNRKVLFLLFVGLFFTVTIHTLHGQGISVQYREELPHQKILDYETVHLTLLENYLVTDVRIQKCAKGFSCLAPKQTSDKTVWHKIDTKLNLHAKSSSMFNYYLYVEKTHATNTGRYVTDIQFTPSAKQPTDRNKWFSHKVASSLYIWINYMEVADFETPLVRDFNILFGTHDMQDSRDHWHYQTLPITLPVEQTIYPHASLLSVSINEEMPIINQSMEFENVLKKNGIITTVDPKFKIAQISDLHIGVDQGRCIGDECKFDKKTLDFIGNQLDAEADVKLVVVTGDMIDFERVKHLESAVLKALSPILKLKIPFVFTFGDSDWDWDNYRTKINILNFVASLPRCYNKNINHVDHRMHGLTNYNIKIFHEPPAAEGTTFDYNLLDLSKPNAIATVLDSEHVEVDNTQTNFMYRATLQLPPDMEYRLLFFHYPLPNFRPDKEFKLIGTYNEKHKLVTPTDKKVLDDAVACGYKAISVGHEHENDACIWKTVQGKDILLCYSGIAGESGVTRLDKNYERRFRVFEMNFEKQAMFSWKRMASKSFDPQAVWPLNK